MLATNQNWKDVQKYYQGTFVKFKELGDIPLLVEKVNQNSIWAVQKNGEKVELVFCAEGYELDYCIPKKTVYQDGAHAHILERIPARMWRKGWSEENSCISQIQSNGEHIRTNFRFDSVYAFVNKPAYGNLEDINNKGYASVALNNRFYACANKTIGVDGHSVGAFNIDGVVKVIYYYKPFEREFKQLFQGQQSLKLEAI